MNSKDPRDNRSPMVPRRLWRFFALCGSAGVLVLLVVAVAGVLTIRQLFQSLEAELESADFARAAEQAVVITLREGTHEQRLEMIKVLEQHGPAAKPFLPALLETARDPDPVVREAATDAILDSKSLEDLEPIPH